MKRIKVLLLVLFLVLAFKTPTALAQSITLTWGNGAVLDHEGNELPLGAAIQVIIPENSLSHLDPDIAGLDFLGGAENLVTIGSGFSNPLPYVPISLGTGFLALDLIGLPQPAPNQTIPFSLYIRVWDNVHYDNTFDNGGNYLGEPNLITGAKFIDDSVSYYFDTPIQTLNLDGNNPGGVNFIFNISGMQTNMAFPAVGPVPEPSAMMLAGFGLLYMIRKFRRS